MSHAADSAARPFVVPLVDVIFDYPAGVYPRAGRCRLRVFRAAEAPDHVVVVVTDLGNQNPGPSVTNAAEEIATAVLRWHGLDPARTLFVEHYDGRIPGTAGDHRRDGAEDFDRVAFTVTTDPGSAVRLVAPRWAPLRKAALEALVGGRLP